MLTSATAAFLSLACAVAAAIAAVFAIMLGGHAPAPAAPVQAETRAQLVALAKQYVRLEAERQGAITVDHERVQDFGRDGGSATVTLAVSLTDGKTVETFVMEVTLARSLWQPLGYRIRTIHAPPPIGVPAS